MLNYKDKNYFSETGFRISIISPSLPLNVNSLGGAVRDLFIYFPGWLYNSKRQDFFPEIPLVKWLFEYYFIQLLELCESEFFRQQ